MRIKEVVTIKKNIETGIVCDVCNKKHMFDSIINGEKYYTFSSAHQEWGNDSYESTETLDVCSAECYWVAVGDMLEEFEEYKESATIDEKTYEFMKGLYDEYKDRR